MPCKAMAHKQVYASTNFKDEFPQMTLWLNRKERIMHLSNPFHPWFQIIISGWQNTPLIEVSQLMIFVQTMVPQILFLLFHDSLHNISIQITLKHRLKHYLNLFMSHFPKFHFFIGSNFSVMMLTA